MRAAAREWLVKAEEDLLAVAALAADDRFGNIVAFHAQQCAEKALKALLEAYSQHVPRTHDLIRLKKLTDCCTVFDFDDEILHELSTVYLDSRYPSDLGLLPQGRPLPADVERYHRAAKKIYDSVTERLENM